jgi:hypothetical protein
MASFGQINSNKDTHASVSYMGLNLIIIFLKYKLHIIMNRYKWSVFFFS